MTFPLRNKIEKWMRLEAIPPLPHIILYALSLVYGAGVRSRLLSYRLNIIGKKRLPCTVISVGNITSGGTGKTPVVILLAGLLKRYGRRPVVVSRGYMGSAKGVNIVSDGKEVLLGPDEAGDEPYLMAKRLGGVPVVTGADRYGAGLLAVERFSPDFIILDDGFQHIRLERDINILLMDSSEGVGNGYLLPRGVLREPVSSAQRADLVMVKAGGKAGDRAEMEILNRPVLNFSYRPSALIDLKDGTEKGLSFLRGKRAAALAAIAKPESFFSTLEGLGVEITKRMAYPDHHSYTKDDLKSIWAFSLGADIIVTTEKDGVKLKGAGFEIPVYALPIEAVADEGALKRLLLKGRR